MRKSSSFSVGYVWSFPEGWFLNWFECFGYPKLIQDMSGVHREYDRVFFMVSLVACRKLPDCAQLADMDLECLLGTWRRWPIPFSTRDTLCNIYLHTILYKFLFWTLHQCSEMEDRWWQCLWIFQMTKSDGICVILSEVIWDQRLSHWSNAWKDVDFDSWTFNLRQKLTVLCKKTSVFFLWSCLVKDSLVEVGWRLSNSITRRILWWGFKWTFKFTCLSWVLKSMFD